MLKVAAERRLRDGVVLKSATISIGYVRPIFPLSAT
jgi:hypothetical protein